MRKRLLAFCTVLLLLPLTVWAQELAFTVSPATLRPGKTERISFYAPESGLAQLDLVDLQGVPVTAIRRDVNGSAGENHLTWDGMDENGKPVSPGNYWLCVSMEGALAHAALVVGEESPQLLSVSAPDEAAPGVPWTVTVDANMPGTLLVRLKLADDQWQTILEEAAPAGESAHSWSFSAGEVPGGDYAVQLRLTDETGFSGTARQLSLSIAAVQEAAIDAPVVSDAAEAPAAGDTIAAEMAAVPDPATADTPAPATQPASVKHVVIPSAVTALGEENNYWTLPMGEMDEEMDEAAVWEVLMQPITVIDGDDQRETYKLRKTPDNSSSRDNIVGEITFTSQGVHILETRDDGWTLIEAYNSSYGPDCESRRGYGVTDELIQGYVKTSLLKTITPRTDYALLIDKLDQTMYIFSEGLCIGTLLVSTGLNNSKQSWNETPAGEFLMVSRSGGFPAGNLWCAYGMRINGGCLIHEVPYIGDADTPSSSRDYSSTIPQLGKKASHGCIRVQKAKNDQGQSIKWLWDNIKVNTKVIIWDDTGRYMPYPDDSLELYYNPNGGKNYHEEQYCTAVKDRYLPLTAFSYAELDTTYDQLTPCATCARIMKKSEIDALNRENGF